jgi:Flp pilus assembly protein TadD
MADCSALDNADRLRLALIEDELHGDRPRAALAYLDALPVGLKENSKAVYLRAEAYRGITQYDDARNLYQALTTGCLAGAGYHGLGLVAASQQDIDTALGNLGKARSLLSADPRVRNDYGYALLLAGRVTEAKMEFKTVLELTDQQPKAASNLVLAMLLEGHEQDALRYANSIALSAPQVERLRYRASALQSQFTENRPNENAP